MANINYETRLQTPVSFSNLPENQDGSDIADDKFGNEHIKIVKHCPLNIEFSSCFCVERLLLNKIC